MIESGVTTMSEKLESEEKKALERQALLEPQGAKPEKSKKKKKGIVRRKKGSKRSLKVLWSKTYLHQRSKKSNL